MQTALLSVVTARYLPMAMAMAESYVRHHPSDAVRILLTDASSGAIARASLPLSSGFRVDGLDVLDPARTDRILQYYDDVEMIGATRSAYILHLLASESFDRVVMLDADIQCYAPLTPFFDALTVSPIALTPHVTSPPPLDGSLPDDLELIQVGFINNGCCAVQRDPRAVAALCWLESRVERQCFVVPSINLYNEQTWVSFLPWYFPDAVALVRDPGMNVAYWNLPEREVRAAAGIHTVNGAPLRFVHYSGYGRDPHTLTAHSTRVGSPETMAALGPLLHEYEAGLRRAYGASLAVTPDRPASNLSVSRRLRVYRKVWGVDPTFIDAYRDFGRGSLRRKTASRLRRLVARRGAQTS